MCSLSFSVCHAEQLEISQIQEQKFYTSSEKHKLSFQRQKAHIVGLSLEHALFQKLVQEIANMHF